MHKARISLSPHTGMFMQGAERVVHLNLALKHFESVEAIDAQLDGTANLDLFTKLHADVLSNKTFVIESTLTYSIPMCSRYCRNLMYIVYNAATGGARWEG